MGGAGGGGLEGTGEGVGVGALPLPEVPTERVQLEPKPARTSKRSGHKRLSYQNLDGTVSQAQRFQGRTLHVDGVVAV